MDIAIDLGTSFTSIYLSGSGVVLREPSTIAFTESGSNRKPCAIGYRAVEMLGKSPVGTKVVNPIRGGIIVDSEACTQMLAAFINKLMPESYIIRPKVNAILGVPTGISVEERKVYEDMAIGAGINDIKMISNIVLAAIGVDLPVRESYGGFITSIGGGATEIGVVSLGSVVTGCALNVGGDMMDGAITDSLVGERNIIVARNTVRKIKEEIGTLLTNDEAKMKVSAMDIKSRVISEYEIDCKLIFTAVMPYYEKIITAIASVMDNCKPAIAEEIHKNGLTLVGGASKIRGLKKMIDFAFRINTTVAADCEYATVLGGGKLLSDPELLEFLY